MAGEKYAYGIDFDAIDAIDIHAHVEADDHGHCAYDDELITATKQYFKLDSEPTTVDSVADYYRQRNTAAVVFTIDSQTVSGREPNSVENLIEGAARNNDVLIPFGSVDPLTGGRAVPGCSDRSSWASRASSSIRACRVSSPTTVPTTRSTTAIAEAGVPALFHTGQTGIGSGLPGGHGVKLRYSDPMLLDDVAADFPELTIVMAHPAVPWVDAQIAIAQHKANVFIDLSGWSPKYFPPQLVRAANRALSGKVLFGTDYPYIEVDRWRRDFETLDMKPEVLPLIFKQNALRVLGVIS